MTIWFLQPEVLAEMKEAAKTVSAETVAEYVAEAGGIMTVGNGEAIINVAGTLTNRPSYMARFFGGGNTTYQDIIDAVQAADADPRVKSSTLMIDSPGGTLDGLFKAMDAVRGAKKPVKAVALNVAASAAYGIGSQATGGFFAESRATGVGSIGVAYETQVRPEDVVISSTESPKKKPDLTTEEGKDIFREELDAYHNLFAESIAKGRGVSVDKVNADFGQGATLLAADAIAKGMLNGMYKKKGVKAMSESTLTLAKVKTDYPEIAAKLAEEGATAERDRVTAHLTLGEQSGDMKTAIGAITDGSGMTATLTAKYMAAGMNKRDQDNRTADSTETTVVVAETDGGAGEQDMGKTVLSLVAEKMKVA